MISIVVSSYKEELFDSFSKSVEETIGVPYEIIRVVNKKKFGICEAYNNGTTKAKFPIICFSHEDIVYHSNDWGNEVIKVLADKEVGLIGIAGSSYKSWVPSGWFAYPQASRFIFKNLQQSDATGKQNSKRLIFNPNNEANSNVVSLDGCWLCTTKEVLASATFDQNTFKGFHCYDVDISLSIASKYKVVVNYNILIEHLSHGNFDKNWLQETLKLHKKWKDKLPKSTDSQLTNEEIKTMESNAYIFLFQTSLSLKQSLFSVLSINFSFRFAQLIGVKKWLILQLKIIKSFFRYLIS